MGLEELTPNQLAALIDGTLSPPERERVMKVLAEDEETYRLFVEATSVAGELRSSLPQRRPRAWWPLGLAAAAVTLLAGAAVLSGRTPSLVRTPRQVAEQVAARPIDEVPEMAADWPVMLVPAEAPRNTVFSDQGVGFRAGLIFADLELAASLGDAARSRKFVGQLGDLISIRNGDLEAHDLAAALQAQPDVPTAAERVRLLRALRALIPADGWLDLGSLLESARIAAATGQGEFFAAGGRAARDFRRLGAEVASRGPVTGIPRRAEFLTRLAAFIDGLDAQPVPPLGQLRARLTDLLTIGGY